MCAIYGFLDYGKKIRHRTLTKILRGLSVSAEIRGTDATGISYVKNGSITTFKKAVPAHKIRFFFPVGTTALIGHNRLTTQGSELKNHNNHPFEGKTLQHHFALAHNGVLYNDMELRMEWNLPETPIETDSYVAVQLLEQQNHVDGNALKYVAEAVLGSFVFTVLRDDNTLFLVKGNNPLTLYHNTTMGLYLYASTKEILENALISAGVHGGFEELEVHTGDIIQIQSDGTLTKDAFCIPEQRCGNWFNRYLPDYKNDAAFLHAVGYTADEIEELFLDADLFAEAVNEVKTLFAV